MGNKGLRKTEREKYLTEDEYAALLKASRKDQRAYHLFLLAGNLGLRVGETVALRVGDFRFDEGVLLVRTLKQKKEVVDELLVHDEILRVVRKYVRDLDGDTWLFPGKIEGSHLTTRTAQYMFKRYAQVAGISPRSSIHALRHYKGIVTWEGTKDLQWTKEQMRHRSINSTQVYMHMSPEKKLAMLKKTRGGVRI